ncbi:MAG: hypothetical protein ACREP6_04365 [Candidatus Binataceae bacterium]
MYRKVAVSMRGMITGAIVLMIFTASAVAQTRADPGAQLWEDPATGQLFLRYGPGRVRVPLRTLLPLASTASSEQRIEQKVEAKAKQELRQQTSQLQAANAQLQQKVTRMQPAWQNYMNNFASKIRIGTLLYGDYTLYTHTGFGPQELTQINPPGPGNNMFNSFDITRTYINLFFFPTNDWTFRLTPNIYRTVGGSNDKFGHNSAIGSSLDGDLGFRLKYAYLQYNKLFSDVRIMKGDTITLGQQANPLVGWEEDLYNYRYVNLTPWNFLSLSSAQTGISIQGPIKFGNVERTYIDYDLGVYSNASFHQLEAANTKQAMARVTIYPFGATWRFQGLGLTGFYDYGYGNTTPDAAQLPTWAKGPNSHITRIAALVHYTATQWGIAGEFDYGRNAFSARNLFSASGPPEEFGFTSPPSAYAGFANLTNALLNNGQSEQRGFDLFGHLHIPNTPLTHIGMYEWFIPHTKVSLDPLDFERFIAGVSYQYNEYLRFALATRNLSFYHDQFAFPVSSARMFGPMPNIPGTKITGATIPDSVPRDTHDIFLGLEFNY